MILKGSVGEGGKNWPDDVQLIQTLLKKAGTLLGRVDGKCGPKTIAAIVGFQKTIMKKPDGRIDPAGHSWIALSHPSVQPSTLAPATTKGQWSGDSARWPQEKKLASLNADLRPKVEKILKSLADSGFQPKVFYGWRSVQVQLELYKEGNTTVKFSFHNAQKTDGTPNSYAADIVDKRWGWEPPAEVNGFWKALSKAAKDQGLVWGGDWASFPDVAHVQNKQNSELAAVRKESGL
jgi:D-alanyl-D-alanine carboxypeptidase/Putative peptidoglycan binding domain